MAAGVEGELVVEGVGGGEYKCGRECLRGCGRSLSAVPDLCVPFKHGSRSKRKEIR